MRGRALPLLAVLLALSAGALEGSSAVGPVKPQLEVVRKRIRQLKHELDDLDRRTADARSLELKLTTQLDLAQARVKELELVLTDSRDEIIRLRAEAEQTAKEMQRRLGVLDQQLQMMALLGRPGPLQLLFDAARGGELGRAMGTISVMTSGQLRLLDEYGRLEARHKARLNELSAVLSRAQGEAVELEARRRELEAVRTRVARERRRLEQRRDSTENRLAEMKQREQALERLLGVLASHRRVTGRDDIRRYRGALPWPATGEIVETFGRHLLPRYATYTVCNGLRLRVAAATPVEAVFPGVVAYARYFKGYGNMVVVDHGRDVYSLVAGLATILVRRDQNVVMGTRLGLTPPAGNGGNLYLEFRDRGKASNPLTWLRLKEGKS